MVDAIINIFKGLFLLLHGIFTLSIYILGAIIGWLFLRTLIINPIIDVLTKKEERKSSLFYILGFIFALFIGPFFIMLLAREIGPSTMIGTFPLYLLVNNLIFRNVEVSDTH